MDELDLGNKRISKLSQISFRDKIILRLN